jgi:hypothetical protein
MAETTKTKGKKQSTSEGALAKVFAHPIRVRIWDMLMNGVDSPNGLAQRLDEPLGNVAYHVRELIKYDCIELVDTKQRRGATEHFYRATVRPLIPTAEWAKLSIEERRSTSRFAIQLILGDVILADDTGTFDARADRHLARHLVELDEEGWAKIATAFDDLTELILATQAESANRIAEAPETPTIPAVAGLLFFERAPTPRR